MPIVDNIFQKYKNTEWFFESGTHVGEGVQKALDAGFTNIISVELAPHYYNRCVMRFKDNDRVHLYLGDTEDLFKELIPKVQEPITFWLDGHNSGYDTTWGKHESPLMQELEIIKNHPIKTHTLIIDDLRCWEKPHYDFDKGDILTFVKSINPDYIITYENGHIENDILVAYIK